MSYETINIQSNPIIKIYTDVRNIIKAPSSCWNSLPVWMSIPLQYYCKNIDIGKCAYMDITEYRNTSVCMIASEEIKDDIINIVRIKNPQYQDVLCCVVNDKYYSQEMSYKNYIIISIMMIKYIVDYYKIFDYCEQISDYNTIVYSVQFIKDTRSHISDIDKIIQDIGLKDKLLKLGKKSSDVLELSKQLDNPIMELLVQNGIYAILS